MTFLGDLSEGWHFRKSLLGCTNYFSSIFTLFLGWNFPRGRRQWALSDVANAFSSVGACTNTAAVAHRFFPAFLCFLSRFTRTQDPLSSLTLVGLKFHFPYEDEGLCKTSAKASKLATFAFIPLPPQRHNSKFPLQREKITFSKIKQRKSSF